MRKPYDYDVAIATDLRYPGGNSSSIIEEVKAQAAAGFTTALVHMPAGHMKRRRSFNHKVIHAVSSGLARLESASRPLKVRALVVRQPRIFADPLAVKPRIEADAQVLVINHPPFDGRFPLDNPYYRPEDVRERIEEVFGPMRWAPIGPQVRQALEESLATTGTHVEMAAEDWHNVLNVDEWRAQRTSFTGDRPVIGRHSRAHRAKWLDDPTDLLAAYPEADDVAVKILGGAEPAVEALGRVPANWTVYPFGAMAPADFLRQIDFFVYYHHPGWVEAFGRNSIEAMASGVPLILPEHFSALFGEAALYGPPQAVRGVVEHLYADRRAYEERVEAGSSFVSESFGAGVHIRRLRELVGGEGSGPPRPTPPPRRRRVLMVSVDGEGAGSVARLMRLARALPSELEPVFVTAGPASALPVDAGYLTDYLHTARPEGSSSRSWLVDRLLEIIARERPDGIVFDGRTLVRGVEDAIRRADVPAVWLTPRRRLPRRGRCEAFRAVLRLDDLSHVSRRYKDDATNVLAVPPFAASAPEPARPAAPESPPRALVALGASEQPWHEEVAADVAAALAGAGFEPVVARPFGDDHRDEPPADGRARTTLDPLAPTLAGYDLAVVAAPGHTLTHDLLHAGVPVALLEGTGEPDDEPGESPMLLNERRRVAVLRPGGESLAESFAALADPAVRSGLSARGAQAIGLDGAAVAAEIVTHVVRRPTASAGQLASDSSATLVPSLEPASPAAP